MSLTGRVAGSRGPEADIIMLCQTRALCRQGLSPPDCGRESREVSSNTVPAFSVIVLEKGSLHPPHPPPPLPPPSLRPTRLTSVCVSVPVFFGVSHRCLSLSVCVCDFVCCVYCVVSLLSVGYHDGSRFVQTMSIGLFVL